MSDVYKARPLLLSVRGGKDNRVTLEEAPFNTALTFRGVSLMSADVEPYVLLRRTRSKKDLVHACGLHLASRLRSDPAIHTAFAYVANNKRELHPIYVDVGPVGSENLPWEALWSSEVDQFMARNIMWPIARLTVPSDPSVHPEPWLEPRLRILAILAAAGVDATTEWEGIYEAVKDHGDTVRVHLLLSQAEIFRDVQALNDPRFTADLVADGQLPGVLEEFKPHIVHFFCHGIAGSPPQLALATYSDVLKDSARGSVFLGSNELTTLGAMPSLWLVVLNACQAGRSAWEVPSLARNLIADGVVATLAMRDTVEADQATAWSHNVFTELLRHFIPLVRSAGHPGQYVPFPLDAVFHAVHAARMAISGSTFRDCRDWTLPALHLRSTVRTGNVRLVRRALAPDPLMQRRALAAQVMKEAQVVSEAQAARAVQVAKAPPADEAVEVRAAGDPLPAPESAEMDAAEARATAARDAVRSYDRDVSEYRAYWSVLRELTAAGAPEQLTAPIRAKLVQLHSHLFDAEPLPAEPPAVEPPARSADAD